MKLEVLGSNSRETIVNGVARLESCVIIGQVFNGDLPYCDLGTLRPERKTMINDLVLQNRVVKSKEELGDHYRTALVAVNGEQVIGVGRCRRRPELDTLVLYGFYVEPKFRGENVALLMVEKFLEENKDLEYVRMNRYKMTEKKDSSMTNIALRLNKVLGANTVTMETDDWEGFPFIKFTTRYEIFAATVDRFGPNLVY